MAGQAVNNINVSLSKVKGAHEQRRAKMLLKAQLSHTKLIWAQMDPYRIYWTAFHMSETQFRVEYSPELGHITHVCVERLAHLSWPFIRACWEIPLSLYKLTLKRLCLIMCFTYINIQWYGRSPWCLECSTVQHFIPYYSGVL